MVEGLGVPFLGLFLEGTTLSPLRFSEMGPLGVLVSCKPWYGKAKDK